MVDSSTRRNFLRVAGGSTVLALAGCIGGSDDDDSGSNGGENGMDNGGENGMDNGGENGMDNGDENGMDNGDENGMDGGPTVFTVRIENTAPADFYASEAATGGAIWVTPGAWAVHTGENPIFASGEPASIGLEALAEAGPPTGFADEPGLVDELSGADGVVSSGSYTPADTVADPNDPMGEVPGAPPIAPGGAFEFDIEAEPGQRLSFASMYVPSNDLFLSPASGIDPFDADGNPVDGDVTDDVALFDAGTEVNGSPVSDPTSAPRQGNNGGAMAGATEGVVHPLDAISDGFDYASADDVVSVTATPEDDGTFTIRIENTAPADFYASEAATGGAIWLTPGAWAVHTGENPIFTPGEPASIGLEALAEAGPPTGFEGEPGLVDELSGAESVVSSGAYTPADTVADPNDPMGEVPGAPPIAPGGAFEFQVDATPGQRLSFASMYVPSNDAFVSSVSGLELYDADDNPVEGELTGDVALFDAGTELNGSPVSDPTGAPRQGNNGGAMAGATEGVVHPLDDINDAFMYADPGDILQVTLQPQ
jgi:hypothetical protein